MKLYAAMAGVEYEGPWVLGIFDTESGANEACKKHLADDPSQRGCHWARVDEFELNVVKAES